MYMKALLYPIIIKIFKVSDHFISLTGVITCDNFNDKTGY
ncbi:hypothetical protein CLV62_101415 [Dysgonomonas alginatilytica]|uniref:Uncharacterized protein n=1 Tax=Dysgonomonas alginatilytica TaxID=1605892 RepID=A0A2V3PW51_9BACT|nr:hypothetical protein CLV62_101415 [Dysgonomonas alginatilytica]